MTDPVTARLTRPRRRPGRRIAVTAEPAAGRRAAAGEEGRGETVQVSTPNLSAGPSGGEQELANPQLVDADPVSVPTVVNRVHGRQIIGSVPSWRSEQLARHRAGLNWLVYCWGAA